MYLPYSSNPETADGAVKKREGSQGRPEGDEHDVAENVRHEEGEQDAQQLHEDHRRVYEVDLVLKEYQVVHVDDSAKILKSLMLMQALAQNYVCTCVRACTYASM